MIQPQQIAQGVIVFITRQATERRTSLCAACHARGLLDLAGKPIDHHRPIGILKMHLGILRRHLAIADHAEHLQPPVHSRRSTNRDPACPRGISPSAYRPVTTHAGPLQHQLHRLAKPVQIRLRRRRHQKQRGEHSDDEPNSFHFSIKSKTASSYQTKATLRLGRRGHPHWQVPSVH